MIAKRKEMTDAMLLFPFATTNTLTAAVAIRRHGGIGFGAKARSTVLLLEVSWSAVSRVVYYTTHLVAPQKGWFGNCHLSLARAPQTSLETVLEPRFDHTCNE